MFCVVQNIHIFCDNIRLSHEAKPVSVLKTEWYFGPQPQVFLYGNAGLPTERCPLYLCRDDPCVNCTRSYFSVVLQPKSGLSLLFEASRSHSDTHISRSPLDEGSARRRDLYLNTCLIAVGKIHTIADEYSSTQNVITLVTVTHH
jgi:hypothetical protein